MIIPGVSTIHQQVRDLDDKANHGFNSGNGLVHCAKNISLRQGVEIGGQSWQVVADVVKMLECLSRA